ncbi:MAG: NADP-specific glutamate dehydrogenase GdhA [Desulfobulbus propionicus]|nr:MAG: NADP-specific glutamate dehydrogenase GdhA [Desulfobulbus propionicus]
METPNCRALTQGHLIISSAEKVGLDPRILYEAVIDLSAEGLLTASSINLAAGIFLQDLGLPRYFFTNIEKDSLKNILASIATSIGFKDGTPTLYGSVANVDFNLERRKNVQRVRIATAETRDSMEAALGDLITGHRREYYFSPKSGYHTYLISPKTVADFPQEAFHDSRFLFSFSDDYSRTVEATRLRYEKFLIKSETSTLPLIEVYNLSETDETRIVFKSDFGVSQMPVMRKLIEDHDLLLRRAYWEPFCGAVGVPSSICSIYVQGGVTRRTEDALLASLRSYLSFHVGEVTELFVQGKLTFQEMLFAGNFIDCARMFIYKERDNPIDREIMASLECQDLRESFAARVHNANRSTYTPKVINAVVCSNPDLIKLLYKIFAGRFDPASKHRITDEEIAALYQEFNALATSRFIDYLYGYEIFQFIYKLVMSTRKTNFFMVEKRSFAFRFDTTILDPLVFSKTVHGIFFVNGHYACGTHLRAADIARGGLRLIRVTNSNHDRELDNAVLLNYALGPKAQRLKHKDICESGSKGVIVPHPMYAKCGHDAVNDYTQGIIDLMLPNSEIIDDLGQPEMIFFGPDEGTAPLMDNVAYNARARDYTYWRTITTGKSFGIPHDAYGLLDNGDLFGLKDQGASGTELQINGETFCTCTDPETIWKRIGGQVATSGMTTTSIMSSFRTLIEHAGVKEEDLNLMMTGGPDGDLGANEIQCYRGKICLIIDGGSVLFDPAGLNREALSRLAFSRHTQPRDNSMAFPAELIGEGGFRVPLGARNVHLPDGSVIDDGTVFHRDFLTNPANRKWIAQAGIGAFIPCGGFKDTINRSNVNPFLELFQELRFIVEGANVFFDDAARRTIAQAGILQIKDSSANKGGVYSSSVAEVLTAFLLGNQYEEKLLNDQKIRWSLIRDIITSVEEYARAETAMLLTLHKRDPKVPLFELSELTSEQIFSLQALAEQRLDEFLGDPELVWQVLVRYIPPVLVRVLGREKILALLSSPELMSYRNAILTKKLAAMAFYRFGMEWEQLVEEFTDDFIGTARKVTALAKD